MTQQLETLEKLNAWPMPGDHPVYRVEPEAKTFGIHILTGEACALSMRLLCEVTQEVLIDYIDYTGISIDYRSVPNSSYNTPDLYAVYLTWPVIYDLMVFQLVRVFECVAKIDKGIGCNFICGQRDAVHSHIFSYPAIYGGYKRVNGQIEEIKGEYKVARYYSYGPNPRRGNGNIHAFSGICK